MGNLRPSKLFCKRNKVIFYGTFIQISKKYGEKKNFFFNVKLRILTGKFSEKKALFLTNPPTLTSKARKLSIQSNSNKNS